MPTACRLLTAALLTLTLVASAAVAQTPAKKPSPDDQYVPGPDSKPQEGVPKGKVTKHSWTDSKVFPGTVRDYWVYVPAQYDGATPACLFVCQDGVQYAAPTVFDNLIHKKQMPVTIGLFINPGVFPPREGQPAKRPDGKPNTRSNRGVEYDTLSDAYARFLIEEMLPELQKTYKITDNPDGRCIAGSSSGGICAFTVAWQRPDAFRKVLSHVGSFAFAEDSGSGHSYPWLIRRNPPKPIRVFLQAGSNDLDRDWGSWPLANLEMASALQFAGYDYKLEFGDGAHDHIHGGAILPESLEWLWR
jgi:enterochelin esterase family protein